MFFAVNMLNNWAFAFDISVPVHIILRSFGSVTTMGAGWLRGKKYTPIQVFSVALLTVGVLISAWADAQSKGKSMSTDKDVETRTFTSTSLETGLVVLLIAQLLSAWMGAYVEDIYREHGKHWDENLFYSHFLSLPMFLPLQDTLRDQYKGLAGSRSLIISPGVSSYLPEALQKILSSTPRGVFMLMLNATTQLLCISGVNLLSANSSAVTVTIVLNIRKLVSFMFSIWLFGNKMSGQMLLGAVIVFGAGALYGWETSVGIKQRKAKAEQVGKKQQ
ncbi:UAA transporter [Patellaria atrata CBS 101060]|uniref:UAA transporter n=1 Tax=Patellaria atrata CBS 101060 TaxID=1346257 RepID=A0A9P4S6R0_9PEZI|nr:UAA transporter [Patellaria atrata CBS 101060]